MVMPIEAFDEIMSEIEQNEYEILRVSTKRDFLDDLFKRHVPEKRKLGKVFRQFDDTHWSWNNCHFCLTESVVCKEHEFVFHNKKQLNSYVGAAVEQIIGKRPA